MVAGHSTGSFFYSVGAQEINNAIGMHFDRHFSYYSLRFYNFIKFLAGYGQTFAPCTEFPSTNIFTGFAVGASGISLCLSKNSSE
jgi:hypothetical protein